MQRTNGCKEAAASYFLYQQVVVNFLEREEVLSWLDKPEDQVFGRSFRRDQNKDSVNRT